VAPPAEVAPAALDMETAAPPLDLDQLITTALTNNQELQAAEADRGGARRGAAGKALPDPGWSG
jgi:hypothetical protein